MDLNIKIRSVIQLNWKNWSQICEIPGLVSRDNAAQHTNYFHYECGEQAPYICLDIPGTNTSAYHGDFIVTHANGKVGIISYAEGMELTTLSVGGSEVTEQLSAPFVFKEEDFPVFSIWLHRNGTEYIIIGHSNAEQPGKPAYPPRIEYSNTKTRTLYSRDASDWHRSMTRIR